MEKVDHEEVENKKSLTGEDFTGINEAAWLTKDKEKCRK